MNQSQARKIARAVRNAADFSLLQLHYSTVYFDRPRTLFSIEGFCQQSLRMVMQALCQRCDAFMQGERGALSGMAGSLSDLTQARSALAQALLSQRDDGETARFMQLNFLAEALRVLSERVSDAMQAEVSLEP